MDNSLDLLAMVGSDRQDVMVAIHGRVGVAQNGSELRVAKEFFDLVLDAVFQAGQLLANLCQLGTRGVDDMSAAVDAAGDRLADGAQLLDRGEDLDQSHEL